jgi:long-chain fatty acid transport protein
MAHATQRTHKTMKTTLTLALVLVAGTVQAAGFLIDTQDSRASGMSTAIVAVVDDSSGIFYNPAGILGVQALDLKVGDTGIIPRIDFEANSNRGRTYEQEFSVSPPPHAYAAVRFHEKFAAGLGVSVPFAARTTWESNPPEDPFIGRFSGRVSRVAAWHITPTLAYQPHERVRLGVGFNIVRGTLSVRRDISLAPVSTETPEIEIGASGWGFGVTAGLQADLVPRLLKLGVTYHSQVSLDASGRADFRGNIPPEFQPRLQDQDIGVGVRLPTFWAFGLALTPTERLTLAFDVNWVRWSDFPELFFDFGDNGLVPGTLDNPIRKSWENEFNYHLGAEYRFTEALTGRLGGMIDPTPSPADTLGPDLPDADRYKLSAGVGYRFNNGLYVDGAYQYLFLSGTASTLDVVPTPLQGDYGGSAHVLSLTLGFRM